MSRGALRSPITGTTDLAPPLPLGQGQEPCQLPDGIQQDSSSAATDNEEGQRYQQPPSAIRILTGLQHQFEEFEGSNSVRPFQTSSESSAAFWEADTLTQNLFRGVNV